MFFLRCLHIVMFLLLLLLLALVHVLLLRLRLLLPLLVQLLSAFCLASMVLTYLPTLKFYRMSVWWALAMPLIGSLYLAITWTSAINHWRGRTSQWKGRTYGSKGS